MSGSRPPIPESVKRQVRRECYFGCVVCGVPIYQIDHITDYAVVKKHEADNLALLCGLHHDEKSRGRVSAQEIRRARANPYNQGRLMTGTSRFGPAAGNLTVWLGNTRFDTSTRRMDVVVIDGHPLLSVTTVEGVPLVSANIMDGANNTVFELADNEWRASTTNFDVVPKGARTTIYGTSTSLPLLDFTFDVNTPSVTFHSAVIRMNGIRMVVGAGDGVTTIINRHTTLSRERFFPASVAIAIGDYEKAPRASLTVQVEQSHRISGPWEQHPVPPQPLF